MRSLNYLLKNCEKPAQQIDSWAASGRPRTSRTAENIDAVNDLALSQESAHTKLPVRSPGKLAFCRGQWDASYTKHSAKVPKETISAWSGI